MLENLIKNKKIIKLYLNDDSIEKEINFSFKRKVYTNKAYDTTIIEILPKVDKIKIKNYLSFDEKISFNYSYYEGNSIYVLQYPDGNEASVSFGIIKDLENVEYKHQFKHLCSTKAGSSGAPVLNLKTNKIIGIHKGQYKNEDFNCGIYLKEPIKEFQNDINLIINKDKTEFTNEKEK